MALEDYRRVTISSDYANDPIDPIRLSAGDSNGRILRFVLKDGDNNVSSTGLTCRFLIDQGTGLYQTLNVVSGAETATWEAPIPMGGVSAGQHVGTVEVTENSTGDVVCSRNFSIIVESAIMTDDDGEQMSTAESGAWAAANAANTAAGKANEAYNTAINAVNDLAKYVPISAGNILTGTVGGIGVDTAEDAYTGPVQGFTLYGMSVQDGTPTPDAPVEIRSLGSGTQVVTAGRNIFSPSDWSHTTNRASVQIDGDAVTVTSTTASGASYARFSTQVASLTVGDTYTVSIDSLDATGKYMLWATDGNSSVIAQSSMVTSGPTTIAINAAGAVKLELLLYSRSTNSGAIGDVCNYSGIQVCHSSTALPYTPYTAPTAFSPIPASVEPLRLIPDVAHDELTINADGSGVITRNVGRTSFQSATNKAYEVDGTAVYYGASFQSQNLSSYNTNSVFVLCNRFVGATYNTLYHTNTICAALLSNGRRFGVRVPESTASTVEAFNTWLASNPVDFIYPLATPTTETVPATEMPALLSRYLTAWVDGKDQNGDSLPGVEWEMGYERDINIVINDIEAAIADL